MVNLKQGDTGIGLRITLENNGDLTGADVLFFMGEHTIYPSIEDAVNGVILVTFDQAHTEHYGWYQAHCRVTYQDGRVEHFPNDGYININVQKGVS